MAVDAQGGPHDGGPQDRRQADSCTPSFGVDCRRGPAQALAAALVGRYQPEGDGEPPAKADREPLAKADREHFDNGLAARLLFAMPPEQPKQWTEADLPRETEAAMEVIFDRLLELDFQRDEEGELQPIDVDLSADGKAAWVRFYNDHAQEEAGLTGDFAAAWSKLEGYTARFALLVHLIRAASADPTLADPNAVDAESIAAGVLLLRWFGDETARVYAIIGGDAESPEAWERRELLRLHSRPWRTDNGPRSYAGKPALIGAVPRRLKRPSTPWSKPGRGDGSKRTMPAVRAGPLRFSFYPMAVTVTQIAETPRKIELCYRYRPTTR